MICERAVSVVPWLPRLSVPSSENQSASLGIFDLDVRSKFNSRFAVSENEGIPVVARNSALSEC